MLAKGSDNSYSEEFRRKRMADKLLTRADGGRSNLLTDRQTYISYLEVQLDRVTASCMAVQAFSDRIQQVQEHATLNESRLQNLTQEMNLSFAQRDRNVEKLESLEKRMQERMLAVEDRCKSLESQIKTVMIDVPDIESQIHRIVKTKLESILCDNENLEQKLTRLLNQRIDILCQSQSDSERRLTSMMSNDKDDLEATIRNSEKHLSMAWENINANLNDHVEKIKREVVCELRQQMGIDEIQKARELQSRRLAQLQEQMSSLRPGMTTHLNNLAAKLTTFENREVERDRTVQNVETRVRSAEQICSRIAGDTLKKVELHRQENLQKLKEISNGTRIDSFKIEMRSELRRWEEAMSTLIQNTEVQIKKLADSMVLTKPALSNEKDANENKRLSSNGLLKSASKGAATSDVLIQYHKRSEAKQHPPWLDVLSKWKRQHSPRRSPSSNSSSLNSDFDPVTRNVDNCESNLNAIAKTIEKLDHECQKEVDYMTTSIKQPHKSIRTSESKRTVTRRLKKTCENRTISPKVLATSKKKLQSGLMHRTIKR